MTILLHKSLISLHLENQHPSLSVLTCDHALTVTVSLTVAVSVTVSFSVTVLVKKTVEMLGFTGMTVIPGPSLEDVELVTVGGADVGGSDDVGALSVLEGEGVEDAPRAVLVVLELSDSEGSEEEEGKGVYVALGSTELGTAVLVSAVLI